MRELVALTKFSLLQFHRVYLVLGSAILLSPALALLASSLSNRPYFESLMATWLFISILAGFAGLMLFDFMQRGDVISPQSGCNHWLLRMPVPNWKLALTPIALRTLWYAVIWTVIAVVCNRTTSPSLPILAPVLCLSGGLIGLMAASWMPFRRGWYRIAVAALLMLVGYSLFWFSLVHPHFDTAWQPAAKAAGIVLSFGFYLATVGWVLWAVGLARTSTLGLISEQATGGLWTSWPMGSQVADEADDSTIERGPATDRTLRIALVGHEIARLRIWVLRTMWIGVLPAIGFFGLVVPVNPPMVIMAFVVFGYLAAIASVGSQDLTASSESTGFAGYLLTSPISTARLVWTRSAIRIVTAMAVFATILVAFGLASLWPSNRLAWTNWALQISAQSQFEISPQAVGLRVSAATLLFAAVAAIGLIASHWWFGFSGHSKLRLAVILVETLFFFASFSYILYWFIQQRDWEATQAAWSRLLATLPTVVAGVITIKMLAAMITSRWLIQYQLCDRSALVKCLSLWTTLVLMVAAALTGLLPWPQATFMTCLAATIVVVPLARILIMPVMLAWGRHR